MSDKIRDLCYEVVSEAEYLLGVPVTEKDEMLVCINDVRWALQLLENAVEEEGE